MNAVKESRIFLKFFEQTFGEENVIHLKKEVGLNEEQI